MTRGKSGRIELKMLFYRQFLINYGGGIYFVRITNVLLSYEILFWGKFGPLKL